MVQNDVRHLVRNVTVAPRLGHQRVVNNRPALARELERTREERVGLEALEVFQLREADEGVGRANQAAHVLGERNRINGVPVGQAHGLPDIVGEAAGLHLETSAKRHRLGPRDQGITHFLDQFRKQRRGLRREGGSGAEMTGHRHVLGVGQLGI